MSALLKEFEQYLHQDKHASLNTCLSYLRDLGQFERFLIACDTDLLHANADDVSAYFDKLEIDGKASATTLRSAAALKCFYNRLVLNGSLEESPVHLPHAQRHEIHLPDILTAAEIRLLLAQPRTIDAKGFRDKAMLELLCSTGMRVTELISMNLEDVNTELAFARCPSVRKERILPLSVDAVDALTLYLQRARRVLLFNPREPALFVNVNGERMTRQGFWKLVKHYAIQAGIEKDITPHTLRHSFAIQLLEKGMDLQTLQSIMGHADSSSTMLYANWIKKDYALLLSSKRK